MKNSKAGFCLFLLCSVARYSIPNQIGEDSPVNVEEIFTNIYETRYWLSTTGETVSGAGSTIADTAKAREGICELIERFKITSIADAPCGDFNWMKLVDIGACKYIGVDIVKPLIERNIQLWANPLREFKHLNLIEDQIEKVDLILCRDMLVHLKNEDVFKVLRNFKKSGSRYLLVTTHPELSKNDDLQIAGQWRQINFELPPFNFPKPLALIKEKGILVDELGKHLGLWLLEDIHAVDLSIFSVDYEESLGQNDPYMHGFYENFEKAQQKPITDFWWMLIAPSSPTDFINLCRRTYATIKPTQEI